MVWREEEGWQVEVTVNFVPNMVSLLLTSGARRWYVVWAYVPPNNGPAVHCVEQALKSAPKGVEVILLGDNNVWMIDPRDEREEDLEMALANCGLVDMTDHLMP